MEGECRGERLAAGSGSCRLVKSHRVENRSDRAMIYGLGAHYGFRAPLGKEEHRLPGLSAVRPCGMNEACMGMPLNFPHLGSWTQDKPFDANDVCIEPWTSLLDAVAAGRELWENGSTEGPFPSEQK